MYISEIDDILDKTLDNFFYIWIINNEKELIKSSKVFEEQNYVKHQKELNKVIEFIQLTIPDEDINKIITKQSNMVLIKNTISKYISYYLFLSIGLNYKSKQEIFNNNLLELSRNQSNYSLKIENFFNSESNANIIKYTVLGQEIKLYLDKLKKSKSVDKDSILNTFSGELANFIKEYTLERFNELAELYMSGKEEDYKVFIHSLIKIIIYYYLYKSDEKKEIFNIIETTETSNGEYIFIDVVIPKNAYYDYSLIESILTPYEIKTDLPEILYNSINEDYSIHINNIRKQYTDFDTKIQKLFDTHIVIPIVDDFLLYNKSNEKYETSDKKNNSKGETKIKYIVNKINTVADTYKNPKEAKDLYYIPLQNRNAVLINTIEDLKITNKLKNTLKVNNEHLDLFNDHITYKMYPYISYKDFKNNGFVFSSETTIDAIRNVSLENKNKKRFDVLQNRIMSEDMLVNVVGLAIINTENPLDCLDVNSFEDISEKTDKPLEEFKNILENKMKKELKLENLNINKTNKNYYWTFDLKNQKYNIPQYDISPNMPSNDVVKIIVSYLYDYLMELIIKLYKTELEYEKKDESIITYLNKLEKIKNKYRDLNNDEYVNSINELEYLIYYVKSERYKNTYDSNEDIFYGLFGKIHKLPIAPSKEKPKIQTVNIEIDYKVPTVNVNKLLQLKQDDIPKDLQVQVEEIDTEKYIDATCQHTITWDKIAELKKNNDLSYTTLVYEFIQQYVGTSFNQEYVCKSCGSDINIKKYILDGSFDNKTQTYVTYSIHMDVNIEETPEYEKYKISIRSLDKIIDRVANIIGYQGLQGIVYSNKVKRKSLIKEIIDLVVNHNKYLKNTYLTERNNVVSKYGINKELSNLFIFELVNDIFVYSSKDKDFYKILKYNNILAYMIILLLIDINDSQILSLNNDNICSYMIYKKIGSSLFKDLKIIINKSGDYGLVSDYPVLAYLLYITSCFITRYNLWGDTFNKDSEVTEKKKFNPLIQKSIINTVVELLNTILLVDVEEQKSKKIYLYEILQTKYYFKMEIFKNYEIIRKLDQLYLGINNKKNEQHFLYENTKYDIIFKSYLDSDNNDIIDPNANPFELDDIFDRYSAVKQLKKITIPLYTKPFLKIDHICNVTNCKDGQFHNYKDMNKNLTCTLCDQVADYNLYKPSSLETIGKKYDLMYLNKLSKKYCLTGQIHKFEYDNKTSKSICKNCKYVSGSQVDHSESKLEEMYKIIENNRKKNNQKVIDLLSKNVNNNKIFNSDIKKKFDKIVYKYQKYDSTINKSIDKLLDSIQKILGTDIIINKQTYNLFNNIYIIDHDINGIKLPTPIQIYEKDSNIRIIKNHNHYKRDVIVYTITKNTKYEMFYDLQEKILLGYRELNKNYETLKNSSNKLIIKYSIKNILLLFGFTRQYINIDDFYPELFGHTEEYIKNNFNSENKDLMFEYVNKIGKKRFESVKKLGMELNKYVNRFKFSYNVPIVSVDATFYNDKGQQTTQTYISDSANNPLDLLYNKYQKNIDNIRTESKNPETKSNRIFLKYINDINIYLPYDNIKASNIFKEYTPIIDSSLIIKNDFVSNITLNYIIDEMIRILEYNDNNKNIKTNICQFMINLLIILFNQINIEIAHNNTKLDIFYQILYTSEFYLETQTADLFVDVLDYYSTQNEREVEEMNDEEKELYNEEKQDNEEEQQALDLGDEIIDEESSYAHYVEDQVE